MSKLFKRIGIVLGILVVPTFVFAITVPGSTQGNVNTLFETIRDIVNAAVPVLITLGVVFLIYGIISFMTAKDEEKKKAGKNTMIYGIIGLFVIVSIWGIIALIQQSTGTSQQIVPTLSLPITR